MITFNEKYFHPKLFALYEYSNNYKPIISRTLKY